MTDSSGVVQARYDYDPYGRRTKVSGSLDADFGFTGHYYHQASGLYLALYRAYDSDLGRWISRDPLENAEFLQGPNLYGYVRNSPTGQLDPIGLACLITAEGDGGTGITIFDPRPEGSGGPYVYPSSNSVFPNSLPGAAGPYVSGNIYILPGPHNDDPNAYGPNAIIETDDPRYRWIHGGGLGLPDPLAPYQGWYPTHGCTRMQNQDIDDLTRIILDWQGVRPV
jgi:RHS repeat-associated protein